MTEKQIADSVKVVTKQSIELLDNANMNNIWMWIAIVEAVFIALLFLLLIYSKKNEKIRKYKKDALNADVDFDNIIKSSFYSTELYNKLKVRCHPDRFATNKELNRIADNIFQEITKNKANLKRLEELKEEAVKKLNINLK